MRRKGNPLLIIIGLILAIAAGVAVSVFMPTAVHPALGRIAFFLTIVMVFFLVVAIGSKLSR